MSRGNEVVAVIAVSPETYEELKTFAGANKDGVLIMTGIGIVRRGNAPKEPEELDPIARHNARVLSRAPDRG